jgi:hypothetical protein
MQENIYQRIHTTLSWKRIIGFNVVLFLVLIVPLSVSLTQQSADNRSNAAPVEAPSPMPPANYPTGAPKIDRVSMFFGKTGDTIVILGANFGDYQWASHVYVGNMEAPTDSIVRWSTSILEVKIPSGATTGKVWVAVNGRQASWDGSLLLYDVARSAKIGIQKQSNTDGQIYTTNATGAVSGMIEIAYGSEPINVAAVPGVIITGQTPSADSLGKKVKIAFTIGQPLSSSQTGLVQFSYPGIGTVEILRAELYDSAGKLITIFSDPLKVKMTP